MRLLSIFFVCMFCSAAYAVPITFDDVVKKSLANSYDLKTASLDIKVSQCALAETSEGYLPPLGVQFNAEHSQDLTSQSSDVIAIGNTVYGDDSKYQSSVAVDLTMPLNFVGVTAHKSRIARADVEARKLMCRKKAEELKLTVLDLFVQIIIAHKNLSMDNELLPYSNELVEMRSKLYKAGKLSQLDYSSTALDNARLIDEINQLKDQLQDLYFQLSYYTGEEYPPTSSELVYEQSPSFNLRQVKPENTLDYRIYALQISAKQLESDLLAAGFYPDYKLYSRYSLYSTDRDSPQTVLENLNATNFTLGLSMDFSFFSGIGAYARYSRAGYETEQLRVARDKALAMRKQQFSALEYTIRSSDDMIKYKTTVLSKSLDVLTISDKLDQQGLTDKSVLKQEEMNYIKVRYDVEKARISRMAAILKYNILTGE